MIVRVSRHRLFSYLMAGFMMFVLGRFRWTIDGLMGQVVLRCGTADETARAGYDQPGFELWY